MCFLHRRIFRRGDSRIARRPSRGGKSPPPGGGWPASAGRERNAGGNLKVCTALQTCSWASYHAMEQVFGFQLIQLYRPHSSSVMEIAFGDFHDSFPPGEAISRAPRGVGAGKSPDPLRRKNNRTSLKFHVIASPQGRGNLPHSRRRLPEGELPRRGKRGHPGVRRALPSLQ